MDISVVRPGQLTPAEADVWRSLQASRPALDSAFLSPEFTLMVGACRPGSRVAVVRSGGQIVAFLPFERDHFGIGRAIASGVSDVQALICERELAVHPPDLVRACGIGVWEFDHIVSRLDVLAPWTYVVERSWVIDVSDGYDAYLRQRDRGRGRTYLSLMQKSRKLEREHGPVTFEFSSGAMSALDQIMRWKSAQYERTGHFDRFSRPWIRDLVTRLAGSQAPGCRGTLSTLSVGDRLVAAHFGIRTESRFALWFPAYDLEYSQYSPGLLLFLRMAEAAAALGVAWLDLGKGAEGYKASLASWDYPVASGRVEARRLPSLVRRVEVGAQHRADRLVLSHPRLGSLLPAALSHVDRVR
jgi:CelD/BcsL family acetyltransferase involved in cellulose biosynthesis